MAIKTESELGDEHDLLPSQAGPSGPPGEPAGPVDEGWWLSQTVAELRRVVWPTREELVRMTTVVVFTVVAIAAFITAVDFFFTNAQCVVYGAGACK